MKKYGTILLVLLLSIVLVACGSKEDKEGQATNNEVTISDDEKVAEDEVVAIINGDEVVGQTYNLVYSQLKLHANQLQDEKSLEEIKEATMTSIIDRQLLLQDAKKEGIEVTDEEIEEEFAALKKESSKNLETLLGQYQLTEESFKEQMQFELTMNDYMAQTIKVDVTDKEVKKEYENAKKEQEEENADVEVPPFEEVKSQIKKQMLNTKTQDALQEKIDKLKEKADIEEKLS